MPKELRETFSKKRVLITGHTGFKGSWMTLWLRDLGAEVVGYSLDPPTKPNLFEIANVGQGMESVRGDIRDLGRLSETIRKNRPAVIFHLAAQPIVLRSYEDPLETFSTNAIGTATLLEACRGEGSIKAIVIITTDKVYDNKEWVWGYRENDPLGGSDPYSASKAMAEIAADSYRSSFFAGKVPVATARAGNVIGGGDFSDFRLVPDCMRALLNKKPIEVRNPHSTRPWMHVLDPVHGYLALARKLLERGEEYAESWNFGPPEQQAVTAATVAEKIIDLWGEGDWVDKSDRKAKREMHTLKLNSDKAALRLGWFPAYNWEDCLSDTVKWYKTFESFRRKPQSLDMRDACMAHIEAFTNSLKKRSTSNLARAHEVYTHAS